MTFSQRWRLAPVAVSTAVMVATLLAGCGSTTKEERADVAAEKLYADAKDNMEAGSYEPAIKALSRVEGLAAGTVLAQQSQIDLAYLYWKTGERAQALTTIERFIRLNPSSPALDYAMYLRGLINFNEDMGLFGRIARQDLSERDQRAARDAYQAFKQLVEQFPQSRYTPDAKLRMDYIVNSLAAYEVHVARYYFKRGAYVAAANRAQQAVAEFQRSPAAEEGLFLMVQSYDRLQLVQLRDDALRVLQKNYPDSRFLAQAIEPEKRPWWKLW
ncbi:MULTISPECIES: outer membrane protein assembly factor BamD [Rubrivivax]|uniref:Outer membrane protein assembly factor BamD n=1 Tax=Rubrivivax benzoatilyticus TaxID=316997 RepID=A0ABX0HTC3_9BURK|nr:MULTISPECIES: outer membrane protein assembly factor BamD [Rubrivivax]NHK98264.1 outer membrane protein assembly factor BamD [Rubrivivax benzoatilyticus]NHL23961.1 outer membrane protein assembly factor BamD [Rubrivivax benzoatilyticus]